MQILGTFLIYQLYCIIIHDTTSGMDLETLSVDEML